MGRRSQLLVISMVMLALNGLVGPVARAQCPDPANLVTNCGFELDDSDWSAVRADTMARSLDLSRTGTASLRGDAQFMATAWFLTVETCVDVVPSVAYGAGAYMRLFSGSNVTCRIYINVYVDDSCSDFSFGHASDWVSVDAAQWSLVGYDFTSTASTESVLLDMECTTASGDFVGYLDDAFLGVGMPGEIFVDGFESGDAERWVTPAP